MRSQEARLRVGGVCNPDLFGFFTSILLRFTILSFSAALKGETQYLNLFFHFFESVSDNVPSIPNSVSSAIEKPVLEFMRAAF